MGGQGVNICGGGPTSAYDGDGAAGLGVGALFKSVPMFGILPKETVEKLVASAKPRCVQLGDLLFRQGDAAARVYVIAAGSFELYRCTLSGAYATSDLRGPGDVLGESAFWDDSERRNTALAISAARIVELDIRELAQAIQNFPEFVAHELNYFCGTRSRGGRCGTPWS